MSKQDDGLRPAETKNESARRARGELRRLGVVAAIAASLSLTLIGATSAISASGGLSMTSGDGSAEQRELHQRYARMWEDLPRSDRRWARRTSACESGGDHNIHGGGGSYHGAFQFVLSTWRAAPRSPGGDPHRYSWKTQAVVAVYMKRKYGAHHWPVCG